MNLKGFKKEKYRGTIYWTVQEKSGCCSKTGFFGGGGLGIGLGFGWGCVEFCLDSRFWE